MRSAALALILAVSAAMPASAGILLPIRSIAPSIVRPQGGDVVTITGANFQSPVRVTFDQKEAFVLSVTPAQIQVIAPSIDLGVGQSRVVDVYVSVPLAPPQIGRITYQLDRLEPHVVTLAPTLGSLGGGTRVTIFGDGFQAPVQVFFGDLEAQVIQVSFGQITVISPAGRSNDGVDVRINNVLSDTSAVAPAAYRYVTPMSIGDLQPDHGPFAGGTAVTIHGTGFFAPLSVTIGNKQAKVVSVTDSEVVVTTPAIDAGCDDRATKVSIVNVDDGDLVTGMYTYTAPHPAFVSMPSLVAGETVSMTIANEENAIGKFVLAGRVIFARADRNATFTFRVPAALAACDPLQTTLTFTDSVTGCSTTQPVIVEASRTCEPRSPRRGAK